jgi:hypothetical protein
MKFKAIRQPDFLLTPTDAEVFRRIGQVVVDSLEFLELYREPYLDGARITLETNWNDLLGDEDIAYLDATRGHTIDEKIEFTNRIDLLFSQYAAELRKKAVVRFGKTVAEDVVTDVYNLIQSRAACGVRSESLDEKRWALLQKGAWACGWNGGTDGCFAVYLGIGHK